MTNRKWWWDVWKEDTEILRLEVYNPVSIIWPRIVKSVSYMFFWFLLFIQWLYVHFQKWNNYNFIMVSGIDNNF
jgi:hypothetical protein